MKLKRKTVGRYLLGTFLLSYIAWGIIILANCFGKLQYGTPLSMVLYLIGGFSPTIVACIVLIRDKEVEGLKQICRDSFRFRQKPMVYVMILLLSVIPFIIPWIVGNFVVNGPVYYIVAMLPMMIFGGGLEEVGWRYILQPALEKKLPFLAATVIVGIIWVCWHIPLFLISGTTQNLYMSLPVFAVELLGISFVMAFIRKIGSGIWPCILFHALHNALGATYGILENIKISLITTVFLVVLSVVCNKVFGLAYSKKNG